MTEYLRGKRVLVTGGTGSLGRALLKRAHDENWGAEFVIFSRDESKQSHLKTWFPQYQYLLGDVAKYRDVQRAMIDIEYVFHFAAYKQVPSAQNNVAATVETNVIGSQNIVDAAIAAGVKKVVASSTDKSCAPSSAYGCSKSLMESIFQNGNRFGKTTFHLARYGNVVSSNGSVIPFFQKQISQGGPLTVTHREMTRFWITLGQAVSLILHALDQPPGVIVVPKAAAMSVWDLADLLGEWKIPIVETGIRPGEKIHEAMLSIPESFHTTEDAEHFYIYPPTESVSTAVGPLEYTSNNAPSLQIAEMIEMIGESYS